MVVFPEWPKQRFGVLIVKRKKGLHGLIVLISLLIFFLPAYSCYFTFLETNLSSAEMSYESPDQDGFSINPQSESRGFLANNPSVSFFPVNNLIKWWFDFSYQTISTDQRPFVLRC